MTRSRHNIYMERAILKTFADRLRLEMTQNKIKNINDFSKKTKIPRSTISAWLNLNRSPQIDSLVIIAKFFEVSIDYLLGLQDV